MKRTWSFSINYERFAPGVVDSILSPRTLVPGKAPVLFCHQTGTTLDGTAATMNSFSTSGTTGLMQALKDEGHSIVCPMLPNGWGKAAFAAIAKAAIQYAYANLEADGPAVLLGVSQGAGAMLRYCKDMSDVQVACAIGVIPAVDFEQIRTDDSAGQRAALDAAYGVAYPAALPVGINPSQNPSDFADVPIQLWAASNDGMASYVAAQNFCEEVNGDFHTLTQGHSNASVLEVDIPTVIEFVQNNT